MSTSVDVLSVLQNEIDHAGCLGPRASDARAKRLGSVRAAVAELIEAVDKHLFAIRQMDEAMNDGINVQGAVSDVIATEEMLRAALSRVKGA